MTHWKPHSFVMLSFLFSYVIYTRISIALKVREDRLTSKASRTHANATVVPGDILATVVSIPDVSKVFAKKKFGQAVAGP